MNEELFNIARTQLGVNDKSPQVKIYFKEGTGTNLDGKTSWCSSFINWAARKGGFQRTKSNMARSWLNIGTPINIRDAQKGDIVIFSRGRDPKYGHVGIFEKLISPTKFSAISGNYSSRVRMAEFSTGRTGDLVFLGIRRIKKAGLLNTDNVDTDVNYWGETNLINPLKDFFNPSDINTNVNERAYVKVSNNQVYQSPKPQAIPPMAITEVKKVPAAGIWSIIKFVSDRFSLSQTLNDATINNSQGSLFNFVQKIVQKPWLQFFGTTLGNQYYFYCRKEPFDLQGWSKLPTVAVISENEMLSDDLSWYSGDIYSWFQLTPRGNFYTEQHLQFGYISSVFFEEYADIWGSKPMSQISNYVNYYKMPNEEKEIMHKKAMTDLKYMVESNCYLPFTRQGSLTVLGNIAIKPGYKIELSSTQEIFYVDSVTHNYSQDEGSVRFTTVLQVSRGMRKKYINYPSERETISYFNIINFDTEYKQMDGVKEANKIPVIRWNVNRKVFDFFLNKKQNG